MHRKTGLGALLATLLGGSVLNPVWADDTPSYAAQTQNQVIDNQYIVTLAPNIIEQLGVTDLTTAIRTLLATGYRGVNELKVAGAGKLAQLLCNACRSSCMVDQHGAGLGVGNDALRAFIDFFQIYIGTHTGKYEVCVSNGGGDRVAGLAFILARPALCFGVSAVPYLDCKAGVCQVAGHWIAHYAETDKCGSYVHHCFSRRGWC